MTPESEPGRMLRAITAGEAADRLFEQVCARLGISSDAALRAPLLTVAAALALPMGSA